MNRRSFLRRSGAAVAGTFAAGTALGAGGAFGAETYRVDIDVSQSGHAVGTHRPPGISGTSIVYRVPTSSPVVALSFDDGPSTRYTSRILDILDAKQAPATFFEIGEHIQRLPELAQRVAAGHEVGNHTWSHPDLSLATAGQAHRELRDGAAQVSRTTGQVPKLFRPPYGYFSGATAMVAAGMGYPIVLWAEKFNVGDSMMSNLARLGSTLDAGSILLGHDGGTLDNDVVVATLPSLIDRLRSRGLRLVTVSELLASAASSPPAAASASPAEPM